MKRELDIVIISDVHLGTYGCHADELIHYMNSIKPKILILNGDIIDIWQFRKSYWPKSHMKVAKKIISFASKKTDIYYISGNHDEMLRKFTPLDLGRLHFKDKLVLRVKNKKLWVFHGDILDFTMKNAKFLAKLGGIGYDFLIILNRFINQFLLLIGRQKVSFSKRIKNSVKKAVKFIGDFENTVAEIAIQNDYDFVSCGHIHQPVIKDITIGNKTVTYLNSGDWVESLTALEYKDEEWKIFNFNTDYIKSTNIENEKKVDLDSNLKHDFL